MLQAVPKFESFAYDSFCLHMHFCFSRLADKPMHLFVDQSFSVQIFVLLEVIWHFERGPNFLHSKVTSRGLIIQAFKVVGYCNYHVMLYPILSLPMKTNKSFKQFS